MHRFPSVIKAMLFIVALFVLTNVKAQFNFVVTQATSDAEVIAWVDTIFLQGVDPQAINNITFSGDYRAVGHFTGGFFFGFTKPEGLVMTSGLAEDVDKANQCGTNANASTNNNGVEGDPDLYKAAGNTSSHDACIIEFDFKPTADTVRFSYVFASEEYHDYAMASYNDVFGFFLSGPGITGPYTNDAKNIALIPGTTQAVAINSINYGPGNNTMTVCNGNGGGCNYCQYLIDNSISDAYHPVFDKLVYDAYTTPLVAKSAVQQCSWYHIKLAVGDAGDSIYDTGVMLEKGSFDPGNVKADVEFDHPTVDSLIYESCNNHLAVIYFRIAEPMGFPYTFPFDIDTVSPNQATRDVDYSLYTTTGADSIYIPVGSLYDSIIIRPYSDNEVEGEEEVRIIFSPQMCNSFSAHKDTTIIIIADNPPFPDTSRYYFTRCEDTLNLNFTDISGGVPPYTYDWYEQGSSDSSLQYIITGADSAMVPCLMYDTCGHQSYNEAYVLVPDIVVTAGPDKEMCNDPSVVLEGASDEAQFFHWESNPTDPSLAGQENIPQPDVSPTSTTEYVLTASDNCTHQESDTAMVLMNGAVANAGDDQEICVGDTVILSCNDAATYQWTATPNDPTLNVNGQDTTQTVMVFPQQNTTYSVSIVNDCGYSASDDVNVVVNALPNADAGIDNEVCKGLSYQLQASGGVSYIWSSSPYDASLSVNSQDTLANPLVTPDQQTQYTYIVQVTNNKGCVSEDSMHLFVKPVPVVDVTGSADTICYGEQDTLFAVGTGITPTWSANPADPSLSGQENNMSIIVSPQVTTTYTLSAVATGFDCPATITKTVEVIPELTATFQTEDPKVCQNTPFQIVYTGNASANAVYTWSYDDGQVNSGSGQGPIDLQWPTTGTKTITLQVSETGCSSNTEQQTVEVLPTPNAGFTASPTEGCEPLDVTFTDTTTNTSGFVTYNWNFGAAGTSTAPSPDVTFNKEGTYNVSLNVTSDGDCKSFVEKTSLIHVYNSPTASFTATPAETVLEEATISFANSSTSTDTLSYQWDFNDGSTSDVVNPSHTYTETGVYNIILTVITDNGCEDTYSGEVTVHPDFAVFIPNAFTPNGDGLNDTFEVKGVGVKTYKLQIFSRWGKQVYESNSLEDRWDAADVPGGTYVYVVHATTLLDKQIEEKGTVSVIK